MPWDVTNHQPYDRLRDQTSQTVTMIATIGMKSR